MYVILLQKFEQELQLLYDTLKKSKKEYSILFSSMIAGEDITKSLQSSMCSEHIAHARQQLHATQKKISESLLQNSDDTVSIENSVMSITDISKRVGIQCSIDIVAIAQKCIHLYEEIKSIASGIETYYEHKITEYRDFFDRVYEELYTNKKYHVQDKKNGDTSGLLVCKNA